MDSTAGYNTEIFSIAEGCPWFGMQQEFGPPNVKWCEQVVCSIVTEPVNTWSNIPYVLLAILAWKLTKDSSKKEIKIFPFVMAFLGMGSLIYHATNNALTQYLDFFGMFIFTGMAIVLSADRWLKLEDKARFMLCALIFMIDTILYFFVFPALGVPIQLIVGVNVIFILGFELRNFINKNGRDYKVLMAALGFLGLAKYFSYLDLTRKMCFPTGLVQGHSLWHLLSSVAVFFTILFYYKNENKV